MRQYEVHPEIGKAWTLPSDFYTSPDVYESAREPIFGRSWQWIGDLDLVKVPGQISPLTMLEGCLDEPIVLTRDMDDAIHCVSNVCTHRGMLVSEAGGNARFLRCRYHGRRFGLDGCFQSMPEFEGCEGFPSDKDHLAKVPFGLYGNKFLFASMNPRHSLEEFLKPVTDRIGHLPLHQYRYEPSRVREYLVRAHWALYCENYLEGFHIPFIHASLNETIDYETYAVETFDWAVLQLAIAKGAEEKFDLPPTSPDYGKNVAAYYYWLFPNLMLNFYPWGLSINVVRPQGHGLTKIAFIGYVYDETKLQSGAGADLDRVEREDEAVVEMVQKGLRSRFYDRGRFSPKRENGTHAFQQMVCRALAEG